MQSYMAIGRMDSLVLAGLLPCGEGANIAEMIVDKASDQLLFIMEANRVHD